MERSENGGTREDGRRRAARAAALAAVGAALVPWCAVAWAVLYGVRVELEMLYTIGADVIGGAVFSLVWLVVVFVIAAPLVIGLKLLFFSGHLYAAAWSGAASLAPDVGTLRACALANAGATLVWAAVRAAFGGGAWGTIPLGSVLVAMAACSALAAALSLVAARLAAAPRS